MVGQSVRLSTIALSDQKAQATLIPYLRRASPISQCEGAIGNMAKRAGLHHSSMVMSYLDSGACDDINRQHRNGGNLLKS